VAGNSAQFYQYNNRDLNQQLSKQQSFKIKCYDPTEECLRAKRLVVNMGLQAKHLFEIGGGLNPNFAIQSAWVHYKEQQASFSIPWEPSQ